MADIHDEELVTWRNDYIENIDEVLDAIEFNAAPPKYRVSFWLATLCVAVAASIFGSYSLLKYDEWLSGMLGNIAAGLIASIVILGFTTHKDKNLSYYDKLLFDLTDLMGKLQRASNNVYNLEHELYINRILHDINDYDYFATKAYLLEMTVIDIYKKVCDADILDFKGFSLSNNALDSHIKEIEEFSRNVAIAAKYKKATTYSEFEKQYRAFYQIQFTMMNELQRYIEFVKAYICSTRYGKVKKG